MGLLSIIYYTTIIWCLHIFNYIIFFVQKISLGVLNLVTLRIILLWLPWIFGWNINLCYSILSICFSSSQMLFKMHHQASLFNSLPSFCRRVHFYIASLHFKYSPNHYTHFILYVMGLYLIRVSNLQLILR